MILRCFRIFMWQKENAHIRQERNDAARRVQRYAPEPFPAHAPKLLRAKGASTASGRAQQPTLTASLILPAQHLLVPDRLSSDCHGSLSNARKYKCLEPAPATADH